MDVLEAWRTLGWRTFGGVHGGAARALAMELKLDMEGLPGQVGSLPKIKTSLFPSTLLSRGPYWALDGHPSAPI